MKANFSMKLGRKENQLATSNMPLKETTPMYQCINQLYFFYKNSFKALIELQSWQTGVRLGPIWNLIARFYLPRRHDGFWI